MSLFDDCTGVICNGCEQEVFQLLEGRCLRCWRGRTEEHEKLLEVEETLKELRKRYPGMVSMKSLKRAKERLSAQV